MQVADSRMIASVGFRIVGSGRSSTRTSPGAYITTPRIGESPRSAGAVDRAGRGVAVGSRPPANTDRRPVGESLTRGVPTGHPSRAGAVVPSIVMDNRAEVREFLISRRAKITPQQAGLPDVGARRVPGLRRGEVAALAGVSIEYYSKLERGAHRPASPPPSSTRSPVPCSSTTPNGPTCSTSPTPPTAPAPACAPAGAPASAGRRGRACNGCSTSSPPRPSSATAAWTCWPPTTSAGPCTPSLYDSAAGAAAKLRPLHLPRRGLPHASTPTGSGAADTCVAILRTEAGRDPHDKDAARPRRRAVHPQRRLPPPLERPQRPLPRRRHQALPPPRSSATSSSPTKAST